MKMRGAVLIAFALLVFSACSGDSPVAPAPQPTAGPPDHELKLTLLQGENLSGPYSGTVMGPDGFICTLAQTAQTQVCPSVRLAQGRSVALEVTLNNAIPGDRAIWRTTGCDSVTDKTCTVTMTGDRSVTLSIGCAICQ